MPHLGTSVTRLRLVYYRRPNGYFAADPERFDKYHAWFQDLLIDFSKTAVNDTILGLLEGGNDVAGGIGKGDFLALLQLRGEILRDRQREWNGPSVELAIRLDDWLGSVPARDTAGGRARSVVQSGLGAAERSFDLVMSLLAR